MQTLQNRFTQLKHNYLEHNKGGVYTAIATAGCGAFSNAGIVDFGGWTLIFDTLETPVAADDLRVAGEYLTGNPVSWVVNSHFNSDHWFGNQVFHEIAIILSSDKAWEDMHMQIVDAEQDKPDPMKLPAPFDTLSLGNPRHEVNFQCILKTKRKNNN